MIDEIRNDFNSTIRSIDKELKHDGSIDLNNELSLTSLDRTYKLVFNEATPSIVDSTIETDFNVTLVLFKRIMTDEVNSFDKAYCKAIEIHAKLQSKDRISQNDFIKNISCTSIVPSAIDSDDKAFSFTLQFTVTTEYRYQN